MGKTRTRYPTRYTYGLGNTANSPASINTVFNFINREDGGLGAQGFWNVVNPPPPNPNPVVDCSVCCPNDPELLMVPNQVIGTAGMSFRDIATQLCQFKANLLSYPLSQHFLSNPYYHSDEAMVEDLDRLWARLANQEVNDLSGVPVGHAKRITFVANDGTVFIDTSTFIPGTSNKNFTIVFINLFSNYKYINNPSVPQYNTNMNSSSISFNYEQTDISGVTVSPSQQSGKFLCLKCGSDEPPATDPNDLTPQQDVANSFSELDLHTTRLEVMNVANKDAGYGWASRYSATNFTPNFYVATPLLGDDGYKVFIRLSYYILQ